MPELVRPKDVIAKLSRLDDRSVCEMYARLLPRAMETNPLKEWTIRLNPGREDLAEILGVLPPSDMADIMSHWFES